RKCANLLPVIAQADLDAGQLLDVATDGAGAERCNILLRQEAYASAVDARGSQLAYNSLEFNFALQRTYDFLQLALQRHPINLLSCLECLGPMPRTAAASHE